MSSLRSKRFRRVSAARSRRFSLFGGAKIGASATLIARPNFRAFKKRKMLETCGNACYARYSMSWRTQGWVQYPAFHHGKDWTRSTENGLCGRLCTTLWTEVTQVLRTWRTEIADLKFLQATTTTLFQLLTKISSVRYVTYLLKKPCSRDVDTGFVMTACVNLSRGKPSCEVVILTEND